MNDINIFDTDMFPYLEGEEIKGQTLTLTIKDIKSEEMKSHDGQTEKKWVLYFTGTLKGFVLNKTNAKRIAQMYGKQTGEWAAKQITLTTEPVKAFGVLHNALRVIPGLISSAPTNGDMNLGKLLAQLDRIERIRGFYPTSDLIMACRPKSSEPPTPADTDGWRVLFVDARDYAISEVDRLPEEGDIPPDVVEGPPPDAPMPQAEAIGAAADGAPTGDPEGTFDEGAEDDLETQYPELFN